MESINSIAKNEMRRCETKRAAVVHWCEAIEAGGFNFMFGRCHGHRARLAAGALAPACSSSRARETFRRKEAILALHFP